MGFEDADMRETKRKKRARETERKKRVAVLYNVFLLGTSISAFIRGFPCFNFLFQFFFSVENRGSA